MKLEKKARFILLNGNFEGFRIRTLNRDISTVDGVCVGSFYRISIANESEEHKGVGSTPELATINALGKFKSP